MRRNPSSVLFSSFLIIPGVELFGGAGADTLLGTERNDTLQGLGGDDLMYGYGGYDDLSAPFGGSSTLYGGADGDILDFREGNGLGYGGAGDDDLWLFGHDNANDQHTLYGGQGIDEVIYIGVDTALVIDLRLVPDAGLQLTDRFFGVENVSAGAKGDLIFGNAGGNVLDGKSGNDSVYDGTGFDSIKGGFDDDVAYGGNGRDTLEGERGSDKLFGDAGLDVLYGNAGHDTLTGGAGSDVMYGGSSADQFVFSMASDVGGDDRILDFQVGSDKIVIGGVTGNAPDITITMQANGLQMITVGDVADPLFEIGVRARGSVITESDIAFLFV